MLAADEVWHEVRSDVADHRYQPYLEAIAVPGRDAISRAQKFADGLNLVDIETTESPMNRFLYSLQGARAKAAWNIAMAHEDQTAEMADLDDCRRTSKTNLRSPRRFSR